MVVDDSLEVPEKVGLYNLGFFFDFAIINPEFAYTLPPKMMACGAMDIMSHCWEVYFAPINGNEIMEGYFEAIVKAAVSYTHLAASNRASFSIEGCARPEKTQPCTGCITLPTEVLPSGRRRFLISWKPSCAKS